MPRKNRGSRARRPRPAVARATGRPLQWAERHLILQIWASLNRDARGDLLNQLHGMHGEIQPQAAAAPGAAAAGAVQQLGGPPTPPPRRGQRIWERDVLRDVPQIQAFGQLSAEARRSDPRQAQSLSLATGVVARGGRLRIEPGEISRFISENWNNPDALRLQYRPVENNEPQENPVADETIDSPPREEPTNVVAPTGILGTDNSPGPPLLQIPAVGEGPVQSSSSEEEDNRLERMRRAARAREENRRKKKSKGGSNSPDSKRPRKS